MRLSMLITLSMNGALKLRPGSDTTLTGRPSRTTSACSVCFTVKIEL
jgi:hypothetical protein